MGMMSIYPVRTNRWFSVRVSLHSSLWCMVETYITVSPGQIGNKLEIYNYHIWSSRLDAQVVLIWIWNQLKRWSLWSGYRSLLSKLKDKMERYIGRQSCWRWYDQAYQSKVKLQLTAFWLRFNNNWVRHLLVFWRSVRWVIWWYINVHHFMWWEWTLLSYLSSRR